MQVVPCIVVHTLPYPFPTLITSDVISHFGTVPTAPEPCGPHAPVQCVQGRGNYGLSLEVPRPHLGSLDDPRA